MNWLTVMEYLCHKWLLIFSACRKHFPVLSSFTTYYRVCNQINTTGATSGAGNAHPSGAPEFTPGFQWGSCYSIFSFICMFCRSLFVLLYFFLLVIVLSALLRYTVSDCPFDIFKLFLYWASYCESWCVMLSQWLWIMVCYSVQVVVNHMCFAG